MMEIHTPPTYTLVCAMPWHMLFFRCIEQRNYGYLPIPMKPAVGTYTDFIHCMLASNIFLLYRLKVEGNSHCVHSLSTALTSSHTAMQMVGAGIVCITRLGVY